MTSETQSLLDSLTALAARIGPGIVGSALALRWLPAESTRWDRAVSLVGGLGVAIYVGPAIAAVSAIERPQYEAGIIFAAGLFGMLVAGELVAAIREVQLGPLLRDWLRRMFGIRE